MQKMSYGNLYKNKQCLVIYLLQKDSVENSYVIEIRKLHQKS